MLQKAKKTKKIYLFCHDEITSFAFIYLQIGGFSVLIRQTNIVWILFIACTGVIDLTLSHQKKNPEFDNFKVKDVHSSSQKDVTSGSNLRKRRHSSPVDTPKLLSHEATISTIPHSAGIELVYFFKKKIYAKNP